MKRFWQQSALWFIFGALVLLLLAMGFIFMTNGAVATSFQDLRLAFFAFDPANQMHHIIRNLRLPRLLGGVIVGASLATSGALMQGMTHNALADSGLLGINAGAAFGLALVFAVLDTPNYWIVLLACFLGAAFSVGLIYLLARQTTLGLSPIRVTLIGAGMSALFVACSQLIALLFNLNQDLVFWTLGGISAVTWQQLRLVSPFFVLAMFLTFRNGASVTILRFGDDAVINLGKNPQRLRMLISVLVLILSGLSVAMVGSVSFVGLIVPHLMRRFVGENYRYLLPFSALGGALLVLSADFLSRMIRPPFETPFGAILALLGIPFFLFFAKKGGIGA